MKLAHLTSRLGYESDSLRRHSLVVKYTDSENQVSSFSIQSWESNLMTENLQSINGGTPSNPSNSSNQDTSNIEDTTQLPKITSFAEYQNANITRLNEAIEGKSAEESLKYLESIIETFSFEIWERKEKSFAAEVLKNQIKKTVDAEKHKILPDYDPTKLSKTSRPKKIKTSSETSTDKTIALFMKMGISESDATEMIKKSIAQTYEKGLSKLPSVTEPEIKAKFKKCWKCNGFNTPDMNECMLCKSNLRECEYCNSVTTSKDSKTCKDHDKDGNIVENNEVK